MSRYVTYTRIIIFFHCKKPNGCYVPAILEILVEIFLQNARLIVIFLISELFFFFTEI